MIELVRHHNGLSYLGQDKSRAEVLAAAREHLIAAGLLPLDVDDILIDRTGLVVAAWWGGNELGFVGADHALAQPVTVVNLPPMLVERLLAGPA